jgi:hypothetical protein
VSRSRTLRAAVLGAVAGALAVAGMVGSAASQPAPEQSGNRAAVIVDGYSPRCITFSSSSISGTQALQLAGFSTAIRSYTGEGGAVCAINGTGCAADANCLTCQAPNYWAYFRADSGAGGFTYSQAAATSTQVTDGDVEGWRWGTGAGPGFVSFEDACPIAQPTTTTTTSTPPPSNGGGNGNPPGGTPGNGGTPGPGDQPSATTAPGGSATTVAPTTTRPGERAEGDGSPSTTADDAEDVQGEEAANVTPLDEDDGGGGARTWIAFVLLLGGFGLAGWRIHKVRGRSS